MTNNNYANWENLYININNPVPSRKRDLLKGQTTRTYLLEQKMKFVHIK
nr:MAG TPA: hypothetical protein [Caudoviricetes sp.]